MTFSSKQQQPAEVLHLKRESYQKSVHLQLLQILHILCFTEVNCGTEIHFFLVKFMNSTSKNMNQMRQVFEFLIQGALQRIKVSVFPGLRYFAKRNETKRYFAKRYFAKRYFAKRYFAKWYFAK